MRSAIARVRAMADVPHHSRAAWGWFHVGLDRAHHGGRIIAFDFAHERTVDGECLVLERVLLRSRAEVPVAELDTLGAAIERVSDAVRRGKIDAVRSASDEALGIIAAAELPATVAAEARMTRAYLLCMEERLVDAAKLANEVADGADLSGPHRAGYRVQAARWAALGGAFDLAVGFAKHALDETLSLFGAPTALACHALAEIGHAQLDASDIEGAARTSDDLHRWAAFLGGLAAADAAHVAGRLAVCRGLGDHAATYLRVALERFTVLGEEVGPIVRAHVLADLGMVEAERGDLARARRLLEQARAEASELPVRLPRVVAIERDVAALSARHPYR
jgi:hypothetical protein